MYELDKTSFIQDITPIDDFYIYLDYTLYQIELISKFTQRKFKEILEPNINFIVQDKA